MSNDPKTPEIVAPVAETPAEAAMTKAVADAVSKALTEAIPAVATIAIQAQDRARQQGPQSGGAPVAKAPAKSTCHKCSQPFMACNDLHKTTVVYPKNQRFGRYFQGVFINGIRYLSANSSNAITVPASSDIEYILGQWEANEYDLAQGRKAEHNSGSMGPGGGQFNPAVGAWR